METIVIVVLVGLLGWSVSRAQSWKGKALDYRDRWREAREDSSRHEANQKAAWEVADRLQGAFERLYQSLKPPAKKATPRKPAAKKAVKSAKKKARK